MGHINPNVKNLGTSIVLVGKFAPAMFHPEWFRRYNLVRSDEADNAKLMVSHPTITQLRIGKFNFVAEETRLILTTTDQSSFLALKDLAIGIGTLLETLPTIQLGINFNCHFSAKTEKVWRKFEEKIAPGDLWSKILNNPGIQTLTVQGKNKYNPSGYVRLKVEPTKKIINGVFLEVNNHFELNKEAQDSTEAISIIKDTWAMVESDTYEMINNFIVETGKLE